MVVRTQPDTFGELLDRGGRVRFEFDERISENVTDGDLSSAVSVSPLTGEVRVSHGRTSLEVSLEGGFRPGLRYRVTLLPVVSDMFGNRLRDAFELVFTTGGEPQPTATLAGEVWDRLNGRALNGATVRAVGADSLVHVARADAQGVFAFRYLPTGDFAVTAFQDNNRDREIGPREPRGSVLSSVAEGDTLLVDIPVLAPDTTPAAVAGASALDSVTVVVQFDDYLDPDVPVEGIEVDLTREAGEAPVVTRLFHEFEYARYVDQIADSFARLDSIDAAARAEAAAQAAADAAAADSAAAPADSAADVAPPDSVAGPDAPDADAPVPGIDGAAPAPGADTAPARPVPPRLQDASSSLESRPGRTLPGQRIVGLLDRPLEEGEYQVQVTSVVNINGLAGGGGDGVLAYEPPPPPADSLPADGGGADGDDGDPDDPGADDGPAAPTPDSLGVN